MDKNRSGSIRLQHTRVSDLIGKTLDDLAGADIVLKKEAVASLSASGDLETLGVIALTRAEPPYDQPYKCVWYQGRYFCKYYRRGFWYMIWDQAEASSDMRDPSAESASITRDEVREFAHAQNVHPNWGFWRRDYVISEEEKRDAEASGFFDRKRASKGD